jgi:hypothetical protein
MHRVRPWPITTRSFTTLGLPVGFVSLLLCLGGDPATLPPPFIYRNLPQFTAIYRNLLGPASTPPFSIWLPRPALTFLLVSALRLCVVLQGIRPE